MQENLYPFSPLVCKDTISDGFHEFLMDGLDASDRSHSYNHRLVGDILNQKSAEYNPEVFYDYINPHVQRYFQQEYKDGCFFRVNDPTFDDNKLDHVTYDLGPLGPWINFQQKHEYNPLHRHNGDLSAIIFIDIPKEIEEERLYKRKNNLPSCANGLVDFWCNDIQWMFSPESKHILLFPSSLLHAVYPFSSNVKRVTMSFNLYNLKKHYE